METVKKKLPLVISVPHGGLMIPANLIKKCLLSKEEILLDCDTWSSELYDFKNLVEEYVDTPIARIVVDMNRNRNDLPPINPDGVVKTLSVVRKQVWDNGGLSEQDINLLINDYYSKYHYSLEEASKSPNVILGIDCHTMLSVGPVPGKETWQKRPLFCLGNRGSDKGDKHSEPITAPAEVMLKLKYLLERKFSAYQDVNDEIPLVTLNNPFMGGYITRHHGNLGNIPWLQLEINRRLYLPNATDQTAVTPVQEDLIKLEKIRDSLYEVFAELVE